MKRILLVAVGIVLLSIGAVDWLLGALVPHSRVILAIGAIAIAAAALIHRWQRLQEPQGPLVMTLVITIFGVTDTCIAGIHDVLIPPDKWPMAQWNPNAMSGLEAWVIVLAFVALGLAWIAIFRFMRNRDDRAPNAM